MSSKKAHSEPDHLHTYTGHRSIATISFICLVIIGIYAKIINIYHGYPNKIFIMSPIMTISILVVVSWVNVRFLNKN